MIVRIAFALLTAGAIALAARAARALTTGGALAAAFVGTASIVAGWSWAALLLAFFISSSLLSRVGGTLKEERLEGIAAKTGERDAVQVLANGGIFAALALAAAIAPWSGWQVLAAGVIAAATADTWATEIGSLARSQPRSILSGERVPHGTSGGVTGFGLFAAVAGAAFIAATAFLMEWPVASAFAAGLGGIGGSIVDSLLGATVQSRSRCEVCGRETERPVHCGRPTVSTAGFAWLTNDGVNALCTASGAIIASLWI